MEINFIPKAHLGKWSVGLILAFFVFLGLLFLFVTLGERGGDTIFSNLKLAIPGLLAGIFGIASFFTGLISIILIKEHSIFVFLATTIGFLVLLWVFMEFLFPH